MGPPEHKTSRGALGCAEGVGFRIMARERMAKLLKYGHFEVMSWHVMTHSMAGQNFIFKRKL